jgi:NAD(P) transhydrogenase subunit beta
MNQNIIQLLYIVSIFLFALSLKWMSEVHTSRRGNWSAIAGIIIAILATLSAFQINRLDLLIVAIVVGSMIGAPIGLKVPMTAVPQRTAVSHAFGSLAVGLVGVSESFQKGISADPVTTAVLCGEMILGFLTFTGSIVAFAKLQEIIPGKPVVYRGRNIITISTLITSIVFAISLVLYPGLEIAFYLMIVFALIFGLLLVLGIGGADMPTVIAILNSYAGISAAALGFILDNRLLIVAGALDGSSGLILAMIMSQAMNRSFVNVLFGGVGARMAVVEQSQQDRVTQTYSSADAATVLLSAKNVIIVPGYGMAVAQAQHVVKELSDILLKRGCDVKFAIHPVAGRMPGHMNVLLAEANVAYDLLWEMDKVNPLFNETDVAVVIGANDVTNPAARTKPDSPLFGMPILNVDKAKTVVFIKRSFGPGFAGVDNELFYLPNTMMVLGDAKNVLSDIIAKLRNTGR